MKDFTQNQVDLNDDLATILQAKIKHHEEQIKFHLAQQKVILAMLKENGISTNSANGTSVEKTDYEKSWFWEEFIERLLTADLGHKEFRNSDIIERETVPNIDDKNVKDKVRYAVSMALGSLVKKGTLTARHKPGTKGYSYKKSIK